ncbi:MAG: cytochrome c, partial [Verrucomicrobiae bacterium]|nr:cytochrome c [Verrucomicrobiae bacterium]
AASGEQLAWIDQWMKNGKKVYANCIPCHQASGVGQPGLFPPLKDSEWVNGGTTRLGAILLKGISGPFTVNGKGYNNIMAPWETLGDEKVAQVLTYIRHEFGALKEGDDGIVTTEMIQAAREQFKDRTTPWDEAGLRAIPEDAMLPGAKVDPQTGKPAEGDGGAAQ